MLEPNAVIEPLSEQECERIYYEIRRYLGSTAQEDLTRLYITQRELRLLVVEEKKEKEKEKEKKEEKKKEEEAADSADSEDSVEADVGMGMVMGMAGAAVVPVVQ
jgi:hypothetical protein